VYLSKTVSLKQKPALNELKRKKRSEEMEMPTVDKYFENCNF
jgi:hypothetical protein